MYYVYIIKSLSKQIYYKGVTEDFTWKLDQHNNGQSRYTSKASPWELVYVEIQESKHDALVREKNEKIKNGL